jgi:hypothetical protein
MGVFKKIAETLCRDGQRHAYQQAPLSVFQGQAALHRTSTTQFQRIRYDSGRKCACGQKSTRLRSTWPSFDQRSCKPRLQTTSQSVAALMHHFGRALMMDLYSLPAELMRQWTEIVVASQVNRNLVNMGQWGLSCRLQDKDVTGSPRNTAGESNMDASAPVDAGWDGLS